MQDSLPATLNRSFQFPVAAQDLEGDAITYSILSPSTATLSNGILTWTPTAVGPQLFSLKAQDSKGAFTTQDFTVSVVASNPNDAPVITSTPRTIVRYGECSDTHFSDRELREVQLFRKGGKDE
jgi:hypothetical protein